VAARQAEEAGQEAARVVLDIDVLLGTSPNELWDQAEHGAIIFGLVPAAFHIAGIAVEDRGLAAEHAGNMARLCHGIADSASNPEPWTIAAEILDETYSEDAKYDELVARAGTLLSEEQEQHLLAIIAYIGATLQDGVTPEKACYGHLSIVPYVKKIVGDMPVYGRIVVPFLSEYWAHAIAQASFRFRQPGDVRRRLEGVEMAPVERRAEGILDVITDGLTLQVPPGIKAWLRCDWANASLAWIWPT